MTLTPLPPLPALVALTPLPPAPLPPLAIPPGTDPDTFAGVGNVKPLPPLVLENLKWLNAPEGMQTVATEPLRPLAVPPGFVEADAYGNLPALAPLPPLAAAITADAQLALAKLCDALEMADPNPDNAPHLGHFPVCGTCDGVGIVEPGDGCPTCNGSGTTTPAPGGYENLYPDSVANPHGAGTFCDGCSDCQITCPDCGVVRASDITYCMDCPDTADCPVCQAQGTVDGDQQCMVCFGSGKVSQGQADAINESQYAPWQNVETAPWQDGVYEVQIRFGEIVRLEWGSARRRWYYPGGEYVTDYESLGTVAVGWRGLTYAAYLQALEKLP